MIFVRFSQFQRGSALRFSHKGKIGEYLGSFKLGNVEIDHQGVFLCLNDGKRGAFLAEDGFVGAVDRNRFDGGQIDVVRPHRKVAFIEQIHRLLLYAERKGKDGGGLRLAVNQRFT